MAVGGVIRRTERRGVEGFRGWVHLGEKKKEAYERRLKKSKQLLREVKRMKE